MTDAIELMQRGKVKRERSRGVSVNEERTFIDRKIKPEDTLNKIALQYSVNVAELKRANNLLNDQDFLALSVIKIPMSKLRHALRLGIDSESDGDIDERIQIDERVGLLSDRDGSAEELFNKTDATIAQIRESLPQHSTSSFHFLDARPPQSSHTPIWMLLGTVLFIFVILPLFITIYEETEDESHSHNHTHYHSHNPYPSIPSHN